jgi:hypothetical protein
MLSNNCSQSDINKGITQEFYAPSSLYNYDDAEVRQEYVSPYIFDTSTLHKEFLEYFSAMMNQNPEVSREYFK